MTRSGCSCLVLMIVSAIGFSACGGGGGSGSSSSPPPPPPPVPPPPAEPSFADVTQASNIAFGFGVTPPPSAVFPVLLIPSTTFGGAAAGDCDGDGDIDLFVTYGDDQGGNGPGGPNRLYLNQLVDSGNGLSFEDTAEIAGVANTRRDELDNIVGNDRHSGPAFADLDGDGDLDLVVGGLYGDPNRIYRNYGDCTFEDVTAASPEVVAMRATFTISSAFGDYDLDGDLDMLLTHWGTLDTLYGGATLTEETDYLWQNQFVETGELRFINVSDESGVSGLVWQTRVYGAGGEQTSDFTLTPTFARVNDDEWPDILIAGDFGTSQVLLNDRDGTFSNATDSELRAAQWGMGSALGDIDNDGDLDWFVTSIFNPDAPDGISAWGNRLFRNVFDTSGRFVDVTDGKGVADGEWGWGACFVDLDNDADLDIYQVNGWDLEDDRLHNRDFSADPSRVFVARGDGTFDELAAELGLDDHLDARGAVCADFDEDGDVDFLLLTNRLPNSAVLWQNVDAAEGNNFLRVRLVGLPPNTRAVGAQVFVTVNGQEQMREVLVGGNYIAQNPTVQIFGLGPAAAAEAIRVVWPAVDSGSGPVAAETVIVAPDVRLDATTAGSTLILEHPDLAAP